MLENVFIVSQIMEYVRTSEENYLVFQNEDGEEASYGFSEKESYGFVKEKDIRS